MVLAVIIKLGNWHEKRLGDSWKSEITEIGHHITSIYVLCVCVGPHRNC